MSQSSVLNTLNEAQSSAVFCPPSEHRLVLAGAGSGKTRVLVHRIACLIETHGISPDEILAVTFTNKAAAEMRHRIESMLNIPVQRMWVGTFHGLTHRLLRLHWQDAELPQSFQVIDSDDQQRLIKRVVKNLALDEEQWPVRQAQWFVNSKKEEGIRPHHLTADGTLFTEIHTKVYQEYENICKTSGLVDFSELLLRSYELFTTCDALREHYQSRFKYILVDEFQDTNWIQYQWIKILAGQSGTLMMVGDDDQSIYSWRGAKIENLRRFVQDFPNVQTIRLEENYRSTGTILAAANSVISINQNRLGKELWTRGAMGEPIRLYKAFNDREEARYILSQIKEWVRAGGSYNEAAILYRSNAQSRVLEEELMQSRIPYRVYGGLKFYERAEIKDVLGYLRLIANQHDDGSFERVVNLPTRGIGESTLAALRTCARDQGVSLWQASQLLIQHQGLPSRALTALAQFVSLIQGLVEKSSEVTLAELTEYVLQKSGLLKHYQEDRSEKGLARVENLEELVNATSQFIPDGELASLPPLSAYLSHIALETGEQQADETSSFVHLMTLHAAKGLEFPVVFLSGMEEGLFPSSMSSQKAAQLEEERRLCYVGMTRAMRRLYMSHSERRYLHGTEKKQTRSRFIAEIPEDHLEVVRLETHSANRSPFRIYPSSSGSSNNYSSKDAFSEKSFKSDVARMQKEQDTTGPFKLGSRVKHGHFGEGTVLTYEGTGEHTRVQVKFKAGIKWLVMKYANLEVV